MYGTIYDTNAKHLTLKTPFRSSAKKRLSAHFNVQNRSPNHQCVQYDNSNKNRFEF